MSHEAHVSEDELMARALGRLSPAHAARCDRHVAECRQCHDTWLAVAELGSALARASAAGMSAPARPLPEWLDGGVREPATSVSMRGRVAPPDRKSPSRLRAYAVRLAAAGLLSALSFGAGRSWQARGDLANERSVRARGEPVFEVQRASASLAAALDSLAGALQTMPSSDAAAAREVAHTALVTAISANSRVDLSSSRHIVRAANAALTGATSLGCTESVRYASF
jgi:hypothetical protein